MGKEAKARMYGIVGSSILLIVTIAGFFWLWNSTRSAAVADTSAAQTYQTVEISSLAETAKSLVSGKQNAGYLPVQAPTADQIGRENPFAAN